MSRPIQRIVIMFLYTLSLALTAQNISNNIVVATGTTTPRTEADRWSTVINARDFGVIGNGQDETELLQNAINSAYSAGKDLFIPAGIYLVSGLSLPGIVVPGGRDDRGKSIRIYGQGCGEPYYSPISSSGTTIRSISDAPVLKDFIGYSYDQNGNVSRTCSNGTVEVDHIRFEGSSTTPVILLNSFYGLSNFHHLVVYQYGIGDGIKITYAAGINISNTFAINALCVATGIYSARTGIGFNFANAMDSALVTFSKCSARGFLTGFEIGGGAGISFSTRIENCECSTVYNGIIIRSKASKSIITGNYFEGGEEGVGIQDHGYYTVISDNFISSGFAKGIDVSDPNSRGQLIQGNTIDLGTLNNSIGIDINNSRQKSVISNTIHFNDTVGSSGIRPVFYPIRINLNNIDIYHPYNMINP